MFATSNALAEVQLIKHHENHSNMASQKENNNSPETKLKVTKNCDQTDREYKIALMKKLSELQENLEEQFTELRNKINNKKETLFPKEIETLKKNQTEILELKDSINEMKNALESTGNRADHIEERISKLKERNIEMILVEEDRELNSF